MRDQAASVKHVETLTSLRAGGRREALPTRREASPVSSTTRLRARWSDRAVASPSPANYRPGHSPSRTKLEGAREGGLGRGKAGDGASVGGVRSNEGICLRPLEVLIDLQHSVGDRGAR